MLIADSHEFIELYRGDKDLRLGMEMVSLDPDISYISFAPSAASPAERDILPGPRLRADMLPDLPERMEVRLLPSVAVRFARKEGGGIFSVMPGYGRALKRARPDVILENPYTWLTPRNYATARVARTLGVPVVYYDPGDDVPVSAKQRALLPLERPVVNRAAAIITYNQVGRRRFVEKYGVADERIQVIPKPVDVSRFRRPDLREQTRAELGIAPETYVVAHSGRLTAMRGSAMLARAAATAARDARFADILFLFIGGFLHSEANPQDYSGPNVRVTGMLSNDRMPGLLAAADVAVFPDLASRAGFTTAVAETMAAARPIIVGMDPDQGAVPLQDGRDCVVVQAGEVHQLLEAILALKSNPPLASSLARSAGRYASECMDYPVVARTYLDLLKGVMSDGVQTR